MKQKLAPKSELKPLLTVAPVDFSPILSARNLLRLKEHSLSQLGSLRLRSCQDPKGDWAQLCEIQLAQVQASAPGIAYANATISAVVAGAKVRSQGLDEASAED